MRDIMQICSAHDGPLCSATGHNKNHSDQVPCCCLTQCKRELQLIKKKKKKRCKSLIKTKVKRSICLIMMVEHPAEPSVMFPARNRQVPLKTFTSKHHSSYSIHQIYFNPHKTSLPPDIVSLQGFDTTL